MTDKRVKSQTLVLFSLVLRRVRLAGARAGRFLALEHNTRPAQADWADGHRFIHTLHKSRTLYLLRDCLQSVDEFPIPSKLSYFIIVNFPTVALLRPVHLRILERSFPGLSQSRSSIRRLRQSDFSFLSLGQSECSLTTATGGAERTRGMLYVTSYDNIALST